MNYFDRRERLSTKQKLEEDILETLRQKREDGEYIYDGIRFAREIVEDDLRASTTQDISSWAKDFRKRTGVAANFVDENYIFTRGEGFQ